MSLCLILADTVVPTRLQLYSNTINYRIDGGSSWVDVVPLGKEWQLSDSFLWIDGPICEMDVKDVVRRPRDRMGHFTEKQRISVKAGRNWLIDLRYLPTWDQVPVVFAAARKEIAETSFGERRFADYPWLVWWGHCGSDISWYRPKFVDRGSCCSDSDEDYKRRNGMILDLAPSQPFDRIWQHFNLSLAFKRATQYSKPSLIDRAYPPFPEAGDALQALQKQHKLDKEKSRFHSTILDYLSARSRSDDCQTEIRLFTKQLLEMADNLEQGNLR